MEAGSSVRDGSGVRPHILRAVLFYPPERGSVFFHAFDDGGVSSDQTGAGAVGMAVCRRAGGIEIGRAHV